ncbi:MULTISPECIES: hypothetical protein [unclassified Sphingobacterium]|uniref:hypothetical protein n=1 Tax=unclassified Sphingobacterium TaxID=2609468 RepID=UPI0026007075|nr:MULTISPECIES: hypothetical protein [unclassified Sphingobacterium]
MYIPNQSEYNRLQQFARKVDYNIALDLVHDSILISTSFEDCLKKISGGKYYYSTCKLIPETRKVISETQCKVCKEILPECMFPRIAKRAKISYLYTCKKCMAAWKREYYRKNIESFREKKNASNRRYMAKIRKHEEYKEYIRKYREENRDRIREKSRIYARFWRAKKKEQLKLQKLNQSN